jgi:predicted AlkP superfamily phosphohydrolase/phosphomutase
MSAIGRCRPSICTLRGGRAGRLWRLAMLVCATASVALVSAGCTGSPAAHDRSVIVLGFDGLDYDLTRDLMEAGRLPNLARLAAAGGFSPLATTFPAQSPVAWSSFTTGLQPEGHGIFDFVHREAHTLEPYLSTSRTEPPRWMVPLGRWQFPLAGGRVVSLREGQPFWGALAAAAVPATIVRMPANYPPSGEATRELSGMGTPDLLGTYGTFAYYTSDPFAFGGSDVSGGVIHRVRVVDHVVRAMLEGPPNPLRRQPEKLAIPITAYVDRERPVARIVLGTEELILNVGEWSPWTTVAFALTPLHGLKGICRLYLKSIEPYFELYVTPINIDPLAPALTISTPASFGSELASATGRFYTQGMPEETSAYRAGVLNRDEFLRQTADTAAENRRQYEHILQAFDGGLLFHYFGHVDQVSHMLWRARDPQHPAYDAAVDARYRHVIDDLYVALDDIVGWTLDRLPPSALLVVMSDHGFASWRRSFHLNSWLEQRGYLAVKEGADRSAPLLESVDWSRTRAYGLGLNALYINVAGRERSGIVAPAERERLVAEISAALLGTVDPLTNAPAVTAVHRPSSVHLPVAHTDRAPDLVIGYARGTRNSSESALGALPAAIFENNVNDWSGDHCMDPETVPGVLFSSRPMDRAVSSLQDLPAAILAEFHVAWPRAGVH